jgi:hypothetical protein
MVESNYPNSAIENTESVLQRNPVRTPRVLRRHVATHGNLLVVAIWFDRYTYIFTCK